MKIVLAAHHYPPDNTAGVELIVERAARWLVARGHTVEVICVGRIDSDTDLSVRTDAQDGVIVHRLDLQLWGKELHLGLRYRDDAIGEWLSEYFARVRPDVFHSQSSYLLTASAIEAAQRRHVPVVVSLNDYWFFCPRITLLRSDGSICQDTVTPATCTWCLMGERRRYQAINRFAGMLGSGFGDATGTRGPLGLPLDQRMLEQVELRTPYLDRVLRSVDRILTPGALAFDLLVAQEFPAGQIRLVRSGLDVSAWPTRPHRVPSAALRVGYLGQLAPHKGVRVLVDAFQALQWTSNPATLKIHGDPHAFPRYVAELERIARNNSRIQLLGRYDNSQVADLLSEIDVLVVPSLWHEVSPLVIKEAFAAGVPVVASRLPNLQHQVREGVDGLFFAPGNVRDLTSQLQWLIDEPSRLASLRAAIHPPFTLDEEMSDIEAIYHEVVGGASERDEAALPLRRGAP